MVIVNEWIITLFILVVIIVMDWHIAKFLLKDKDVQEWVRGEVKRFKGGFLYQSLLDEETKKYLREKEGIGCK